MWGGQSGETTSPWALNQAFLHIPPTTAALPSHYHWSVGDQESNEVPTRGYVHGCRYSRDKHSHRDKSHNTHKDSAMVDVDDCAQQWVTVNDGVASTVKFKDSTAVRVLRVIGLAAAPLPKPPGAS